MIFDGLHFNIQIQLPSFPGSQDIEKEVARQEAGYGLKVWSACFINHCKLKIGIQYW